MEKYRFAIEVSYKPGDKVFHLGIMDYVTVDFILVGFKEGETSIQFVLRDVRGRKLLAEHRMLATEGNAKYYKNNPLGFNAFDPKIKR